MSLLLELPSNFIFHFGILLVSLLISMFSAKLGGCSLIVSTVIEFWGLTKFSYPTFDKLFILAVNQHNILLAKCFCLVMALSTIFILKQVQKKDLFIRHLTLFFSQFGVFAENWLGIFLALELLTLSNAAQILIGRERTSGRYFIKYLALNLLSSCLLIIGINQLGIWQVNLGEYFYASNIYIVLGLLLHLGVAPFVIIVMAYQAAANNAKIILPLFSSKVVLYLLITKLEGPNWILYPAIITVIYAIYTIVVESRFYNIFLALTLGDLTLILIAHSLQVSANILIPLIGVKILAIYFALQNLHFLMAKNIYERPQLVNNYHIIENNFIFRVCFFSAGLFQCAMPFLVDGYLKNKIIAYFPISYQQFFSFYNFIIILGILFKTCFVDAWYRKKTLDKNQKFNRADYYYGAGLIIIMSILLFSPFLLNIITIEQYKEYILNLPQSMTAKTLISIIAAGIIYKGLSPYFNRLNYNNIYLEEIYLLPVMFILKLVNYFLGVAEIIKNTPAILVEKINQRQIFATNSLNSSYTIIIFLLIICLVYFYSL